MPTLSPRAAVVAASQVPAVQRLLTQSRAARPVVRRFVAGETAQDALAAALALQQKRITTAFDLLGENVSTEPEASRATDGYCRVLDLALSANLRDVYLSVKLTALGLDLGNHIAARNLRRLLSDAAGTGAFVRVDMEGSDYTERTLGIVEDAHAEFADVGTVLQAALYRTPRDAQQLSANGISVRLVKGAYAEPATVAYPRKADVDAAYVRLMEHLLLEGTRPALATHDETLLRHAKRFVRERSIPNDGFEFQLLYGIRRDVQEGLASEGYRVRAYVPFGTQWYPYFVRRLAERPANALFLLRSLGQG